MLSADQAYPVIDGFTFSTKFRCNMRFRNVAVQEYEAIRRAGALRNKSWLTPQDSTILIPALDSYERQIWMPEGSVIWGYTFVGLCGEQDNDSPEEAGTQSWEVRDGCDDVPLFSEVVTQQLYAGQPNRLLIQNYLAKPLLVGPPGLINVVICNTFRTPQVGQLILYGGEPVK